MGKGFYEYQANRMITECQNLNIYKAKMYPKTGNEDPEGEKRYSSTPSLTPHPNQFTPGKDPVPIV
jgi:hypothetical protein